MALHAPSLGHHAAPHVSPGALFVGLFTATMVGVVIVAFLLRPVAPAAVQRAECAAPGACGRMDGGSTRTWWTAPRGETVVDAWWSVDGRRIWLLADTGQSLEMRHLDVPGHATGDWWLGPPDTSPPTTTRLVGLAGSGDSLVVALEGSWGTKVVRIDQEPLSVLFLGEAALGEPSPAFAGWATVPAGP